MPQDLLAVRGQEHRRTARSRKWNSGTNWCIGANAICLGCTESGFPDNFSPFYTKSYSYSEYQKPGDTDTIPPSMQMFAIPSTANSLTVAITALSATDNTGVTGYLLTEAGSKPAATATGWTSAKPSSYTFASAGAKTLYAWAKDAAGNVSNSMAGSVTITLPTTSDTTAPTITAFDIPSTSTSLAVAITTFTASDNVGVTGYLLTETGTKPVGNGKRVGACQTGQLYIFIGRHQDAVCLGQGCGRERIGKPVGHGNHHCFIRRCGYFGARLSEFGQRRSE